MRERIVEAIEDSKRALDTLLLEENQRFIEEVATHLSQNFQKGGKVIIAGNGGSLCDASHFAEELTGFFSKNRRAPLPVIVLSEPGFLTCTANDLDYDQVFSRGVEAFHQGPYDSFIGLSTSGNSRNIIRAVECAKELEMTAITLLGEGGKLQGMGDYELMVPGFQTSDRVQEAHMMALHLIVECIEKTLFPL